MHIEEIKLAAPNMDFNTNSGVQTYFTILFDRRVNLFIGPNSTGKSSLINVLKHFNAFTRLDASRADDREVNYELLLGLAGPRSREELFIGKDNLTLQNTNPLFQVGHTDDWDGNYFSITTSTDWPQYLERYYTATFDDYEGTDSTTFWEHLDARLHGDKEAIEQSEVPKIELTVREYRLTDSVPLLYIPAVRLNLTSLKTSDWLHLRQTANTFKHLPGMSSLASFVDDPLGILYDLDSEIFYGHVLEYAIQFLRESMAEDVTATQDQLDQLENAINLAYSCSKVVCSEVVSGDFIRKQAEYKLPSHYMINRADLEEEMLGSTQEIHSDESWDEFEEEILNNFRPMDLVVYDENRSYSPTYIVREGGVTTRIYIFVFENSREPDRVTVEYVIDETSGQERIPHRELRIRLWNGRAEVRNLSPISRVSLSYIAEQAGSYYYGANFYRKELIKDIPVESNLRIQDAYRHVISAAEYISGTQGTLLWILAISLRIASHHDWKAGWENEPAILLIDEIENHLHPTWQRRVIPALLEHFPGLQIFATTHSPFVVAGLKAGQVHLLKRDEKGRVTASTNTEDIVGWTTDEILRTMMGVDDPTDDATAAAASELRQLRQEPPRATPEEEEQRQQRIQELRQKVDRDLLAGGPMARQREIFEERFARVIERYRESQDLNQEGS